MKVFGVGLNKTGTTTLARCLRILGFEHTSCSLELTRQYQRGNLQPLFEHADQFESFEDWPWPLVYKEMDRRYDNAKFILTRRSSADKWFDSLWRHALRTGPTEFRDIAYGHSMPLGKRRSTSQPTADTIMACETTLLIVPRCFLRSAGRMMGGKNSATS